MDFATQTRYPVYQPLIGDEEAKLVAECIKSGWISSRGTFVSKFEDLIASYIEPDKSIRGKAIATANGTLALHLAMLALGIGPGDEVIVPSFTYIASTNCVEYVGAKVVFCDCSPFDWNLDIESVKKLITPRTRALIAVNLYGNPCNGKQLRTLCDNRGIFLVEDCAESLGATFGGFQSGKFSHICTFSFFGNKTITTGEGGAIYTEIDSIYDRANRIKSQGLAKHREYWHDIVGHNFRMTNVAAAIGVSQFQKIDTILSKKRSIDALYRKLLDGFCDFQGIHAEANPSFWMTTILVRDETTRDSARKVLSTKGIETRPSFYPVNTMPIYSDRYNWLKNTEEIAIRGINLPSYPALLTSDVELIASEVKVAINGLR